MPPSRRKGRSYTVFAGHDIDPIKPPKWLLDLIPQKADVEPTDRGKTFIYDQSRTEAQNLNDEAMCNLDLWMPKLFPKPQEPRTGWYISEAKKTSGGYEVIMKRGLPNNERLSADFRGIKDFGVHDMGDPRGGKRTPIDLVLEWHPDIKATPEELAKRERSPKFEKAFAWLSGALGHPPNDNDDDDDEQDEASRPIIRIKAGELPKIATRGEKVLLASGLPIYQRGDDLVRPIIEDVPAAHDRTTKVARLIRIDAVYLSDVLGRVAQWQRKVWGHWVPTDVPQKVATRILGRKGEWKFPKVSGVISTPTMRYDGTILDQEGYDPQTKLLLLAPPSMPAIPEMPTRDDALASLALLEDLLVEFPLVEEVDKAVALSGFITPVVRGAFIVAPMHTSRAPVAGSGKSYLWDCSSIIATGQIMPVISKGANEEELEKRLGTEMMTGQPLISIDNVNGELKSDALCQITERSAVHIRILGKSERVRVEPRGTTIFCTGNNIIIVGDLHRRVITAMLDPQLERPELREFNGNPVAKILANRGSYIAACLTICRAYIAAGRPNKAKRLASYEGWSDTVRSALMWLGKADPVISIEAARADDPELNELRELLEAWAEVFGVGKAYRFTLQEIIDEANSEKSSGPDPRWPRLNSAVRSVAAWRREPADAKRLALYLRSKKGRIVNGMRFTNDLGSRRATWWIEAKNRSGEWDKEKAGEFRPAEAVQAIEPETVIEPGTAQVIGMAQALKMRVVDRKKAAENQLAYAQSVSKWTRQMRH